MRSDLTMSKELLDAKQNCIIYLINNLFGLSIKYHVFPVKSSSLSQGFSAKPAYGFKL